MRHYAIISKHCDSVLGERVLIPFAGEIPLLKHPITLKVIAVKNSCMTVRHAAVGNGEMSG